MDLGLIVKEIRTHKLVALPVILLTLLAAGYVAVGRPSTYESESSMVLINPPAAPTASQIAADPSLAKVNTNNPYVAYNDLTVVAALVEDAMYSQTVVDHLFSEGASDNYVIQPNPDASAPILEITEDGPSPIDAERATGLVDQQVTTTLDQLQQSEGVDKAYWITAQVLSEPAQGKLQLSHKLRDVIAILALGLVIMFAALSVRRGMADRARRRPGADAPEAEAQDTLTPGLPLRRLPHTTRVQPSITAESRSEPDRSKRSSGSTAAHPSARRPRPGARPQP